MIEAAKSPCSDINIQYYNNFDQAAMLNNMLQ